MLSQQKKAQTQLINVSLEDSTMLVKAQVDNGFGVLVDNPADAGTEVKIKYRVFHEKAGPNGDKESPAGLSTNLSRAIMTDYKNVPQVNAVITYESKKFRIGRVDPLKKFGGIYGYQAPLIEAGV